MISTINTGAMPVNALLRQQTERRADQAEQQAQALENQAAAKRREARQAEATARLLEAEADQAAAESGLLRENLNAADRIQQSGQNINERLSLAIDTTTTTKNAEQNPATDNNLTREMSKMLAAITENSSGSIINLQV